ncbi:hypothetical protein [Aurantiacibacter gangjinensis]|nr:hypothetical protein [Aurantiacibacter gangjinensis]
MSEEKKVTQISPEEEKRIIAEKNAAKQGNTEGSKGKGKGK